MEWFTNNGLYMTLIHCMNGDMFWVQLLVISNILAIIAYSYLFLILITEARTRGSKERRLLYSIAITLMICSISGYLLPILRIVWPAYRLQVILTGVFSVSALSMLMRFRDRRLVNKIFRINNINA